LVDVDMKSHTPIRASLIEEAQDWERALKSGDPAARTGFTAWIRRSPEHVQAFLQLLSLQEELGGLDPDKQFDLRQLLTETSGNVVPITSARVQHGAAQRVARRISGYYGLAAALVGLAVGIELWQARSTPTWTDYATVTGEQRRVALPDGSIIELNTQSHVRVAYTKKMRDIELIDGEAVFGVQHNALQPFRVHARGSVIEDLGTEFSVYIHPDSSTTVAVLAGRVEVSPDSLRTTSAPASTTSALPSNGPTGVSAGQGVRIDASGKMIDRFAVNVAEAAAWRQHRVWFESASLEQVVADFNRYNARKIQIDQSPVIAQKRYTATWDPYDPASFIEYLQADPALIVQTERDRTTVRAR
jgi:transmembrane sensor